MNIASAVPYTGHPVRHRTVLGAPLQPRTYLRLLHLVLMFPLGLAYFVGFVVALAVGGALVWTIPGLALLLVAAFFARALGRFEARMVTLVTGEAIRRPPEGIDAGLGLRQRVTVRLIDPTTWTSLVYLTCQVAWGIAGLVLCSWAYATGGALVLTPLFHALGLDVAPLQGLGNGLVSENSGRALIMAVPGAGLLAASGYAVLALSTAHAKWARFMLGSRARLRPLPPPLAPGGDDNGPTPSAAAPVPSPAFAELTPRESEVLRLISAGYSNAEIAESLVVSEGTVKTHVKRVLDKLQVRDRTQAAILVLTADPRLLGPPVETSAQL